MKFIITKVSDHDFREEREISTLEDLKALEKEHPGWLGRYKEDKDFIINFGNAEAQPKITIYDDWIE